MADWINNPTEWAKDNDSAEFKDFRYFVYDTEPKVSRGIACQLANAKAASAVAGEITQFVKDSFGQSVQGDPTSNDTALEEYVENTLVQEIQSFVVGAQVFKTYWEKRSYKVEMGAPENKTAYTCAVLIKMSKKNIAKALERAQNLLEKNAKKETKENVRGALKDAAEKFNSLDSANSEQADQTEPKKDE